MRPGFSIRGVVLVVGVVAYAVLLYRYRLALTAGLFLILLGLLGFPANTSGRPGDDPTYDLGPSPLGAAILILFLPPVVLVGLARLWRPRSMMG